MFYCDPCAEERHWPKAPIWTRSKGPCELCRKVKLCNDVHHKLLKADGYNAEELRLLEDNLAHIADKIFKEYSGRHSG